MTTDMRKTGVDVVGDMAWGTHFCLFYETKMDLLETTLSYCRAGLESQEFCLWVVAEPVTVEEATLAFKQGVADSDRYLAEQSIEIVAARDWYLHDGVFDLKRVISGWNEKLAKASAKGYAGVRVTGDTAWLEKKDWKDFCEYEESLNHAVANQRLAVLCTYPLACCGAAEILDVVRTHQFAVTKRRGSWDVIETAGHKQAKAEIKRLNEQLEQRVAQRTSQLTAVNQKLRKEILERQRGEALRNGESRVLEMIARDAPLQETLDMLVRVVEAQFNGLLCSVLLLDEDGQHIRHGAAPSLPAAYTAAIDGLAIGPETGSCGTAMYRRAPVVVTDILHDPLWKDFRSVAEPYGLRACWSTPILAHSGKALGSFAMYYREPRSPSPAETHALEMATHLAGIAIARKHTYEQLQRSEAYLAQSQRMSHTGSWAFNTVGSLYWSEENFLIWGFNPQQGLPDRETVLRRVHPEDRDRVVEHVLKAVREKADYVCEFRIVLPGGTVKHIQGLGHPVFNAAGELIEVVGTQFDVTERKRAEEERERLRQAQADLAHIHRVTTMGELTASLAHEIKQPIAAAGINAKTCLRWLGRDTPDMEEAREAASRMVTDVTRAAEIIGRIGSLFKKGVLQPEWVDVNELIQVMVVLLRSEAARYSISIRCDLDPVLPKVMADRIQLQQVFMNLMINGIEAMKDGCPAAELTIRSQRAEDGQLLISVSDTGTGLPPQQADQIFDAFFTTKDHGTGMGLPISRSIIESHGGRLWASSNPGRGTSFHFSLATEARHAQAG